MTKGAGQAYCDIDPRFDPALILTGDSSGKGGFETIEMARTYARKHRDKLWQCEDPNIVEAGNRIDTCVRGYEKCNQAACSICMRDFRRWFASEILRNASEINNAPWFVTLLVRQLPEGDLEALDLQAEQRRVRQKLARAGIIGPMIGGIEVAWKRDGRYWVVHCHLIAFANDQSALDKVHKVTFDTGLDDEIDDVLITELPRVATYVLKFGVTHTVRRNGRVRSRNTYPLNGAPARELAKFYAENPPKDFVLLFGAKRLGRRIEFFQSTRWMNKGGSSSSN